MISIFSPKKRSRQISPNVKLFGCEIIKLIFADFGATDTFICLLEKFVKACVAGLAMLECTVETMYAWCVYNDGGSDEASRLWTSCSGLGAFSQQPGHFIPLIAKVLWLETAHYSRAFLPPFCMFDHILVRSLRVFWSTLPLICFALRGFLQFRGNYPFTSSKGLDREVFGESLDFINGGFVPIEATGPANRKQIHSEWVGVTVFYDSVVVALMGNNPE